MNDLAVCVDGLITSESLKPGIGSNVTGSSDDDAALTTSVELDELDEEEPLIQSLECRICQEEDSFKNLEVPCSCNGSLKFAHRECVQKWCNEKGDTICEICHQLYRAGYTAPTRPPADETAIDISEWTVAGAPLEINDPRLLAMTAAERRLLEAEYNAYADSYDNGASFCRSVALILMALLFLRHALYVTNPDEEEDDVSTFFSLFMLRAAGFLLPCYIMAWAISVLQRRRQRQESATLPGSEVAYVIQAGQHGGVHFTIASAPAVALHPELHQ